ncbi:hypothetical protein BJY24_007676 [Nocardia transvalensis]|uniref:Uncharacterized protein n=1 Tax=Nocardia transvalensis TaxID=37333 RepID=A0A7W9PN74_9NOCA|nr:type VII secretion target [Nocardia transvalensis]MBB5918764.1 hypothetical protein [Nocardia transvalensis]
MPEKFNIDPDWLRQKALEHEGIAADTRKWAAPPSEWLNSFPDTYGKIAHPVHQALLRYYTARERAGNALADEHQYTADSLREAALAYERADGDGVRDIRMWDGGGHDPNQQLVPTGPGGPGAGPTDGGPAGGGPAGGPPGRPSVGSGPNGAAPSGPSGPQDPTATGPDAGRQTPLVTGPNTGGPGAVPAAASAGGPGTTGMDSTSSVVPPAGSIPPGGPGGGPGGPGAGPFDDRSGAQSGSRFDVPPVPFVSPFAAAVAKAKDEAAEPAYVVGDQVDDDLVLAKTLLGGLLAATDSSAVGLHWAVAVLRGPGGAGVFVTSNEGRGWLPPSVFLPREVSTPWLWDEVLSEADEAGSPWEGVSDPARILVEFGLAWGPKAAAQLSALVSSGPLDPGLRARFSDVPMEGLVGPSHDLDLRAFTPDTADRLGLTGSAAALNDVASVPDNRVHARCVELAVDAHSQVGAGGTPPEAAGARGLRQRILTALQAGRPVPEALWQELRDADDLLAAAMMSRRVDVGRVDPGQLRVDDNPALRAMVFERRCNELALLLADEEQTRQHLRDAVYAHEQIVEHPQFVAAPAAVSAGEPQRVDRPAASSAQVTAPPSGAVSAPAVSVTPPATPPPATDNRS